MCVSVCVCVLCVCCVSVCVLCVSVCVCVFLARTHARTFVDD